MRAYTSTYLILAGLLGSIGCSEEPELGPPLLYNEVRPDAGPTNCNLQGTWQIMLSTEDLCSPTLAGAAVTLTVGNGDAGSEDFATGEPVPDSGCAPYDHEVQVSADGCTIEVSSKAEWCTLTAPGSVRSNMVQCTEYDLTLHVQEDDTADVKGNYRKCWCGSPGPYGKKVRVSGSATKR